MSGFLDGVSDAFDALSTNVLPFYTASVAGKNNASDNAAAAAIATANANSAAAEATAKAKVYTAVAVGGVAFLALLIIIKRRRGIG